MPQISSNLLDDFGVTGSHYALDLRLVLPLLAFLLYSTSGTISGHSMNDFRCSHLPPTPEQVSYVWLSSENFSAFESHNGSEGHREYGNKFKRHIGVSYAPESSSREFTKGINRKSGLPTKGDLIPVKIQVHYDDSVFLIDEKKLELIADTVMPSVVDFFESVLSIRRDFIIDRFRITRRCPNNTIYYARDIVGLSRPYCMDRCEDYAICGEMIVPTAHLSACSYCNSTSKRCLTNYSSEGKGVANAQLLLYVSAKQTARCKKDQTIAYAAHCAQDAKTDRPVAGHANLCPNSISTDPKDLRALIATVKHELTHVLGFSVSLFAYYRDEFGLPLTNRDSSPGPIPIDPKTGYAKWSDKIIKKVIRTNWVTGEGLITKEAHLIVTPTVTREVQQHFNCSSLEGAELEDQGSDGTSMTHWEKRLFENEAMTGTHTQNSVYSRLTLAVLQDTGWYVANFSRAEKLNWGRNLGCDFAKKSCKSWIDEKRAARKSIRPFCDRIRGDLLQIGCTEDRSSKAVCNMKQYKDPLPAPYQNFDQLEGVPQEQLAYFGGSVDLADYCPFIQEFTWQAQNVTIRGSRCDSVGNNLEPERNAALEYYGSQAKCFEHGRRWEQRSCLFKRHWHHYGAGCYRYICSDGHITVTVGNHSYPCYYGGQELRIEQLVDQWLYNGTILCPSCEGICPASMCKSYDRKVIDKVSGQNESSAALEPELKNTLNSVVDYSVNAVDIDPKLVQKLASKSNITGTTSEQWHDKERLMKIFAEGNETPRHSLKCSNANNLLEHRSKLMIVFTIMMVGVGASFSSIASDQRSFCPN